MEKLQEINSPNIREVRGLGLMIGVELVRDRLTKEPAVQERDRLLQVCFRKGLLLLPCGASTVRFCPPLVQITRDKVRRPRHTSTPSACLMARRRERFCGKQFQCRTISRKLASRVTVPPGER